MREILPERREIPASFRAKSFSGAVFRAKIAEKPVRKPAGSFRNPDSTSILPENAIL